MVNVEFDYSTRLVKLSCANQMMFLSLIDAYPHVLISGRCFMFSIRLTPKGTREEFLKEADISFTKLIRTCYIKLQISFNELIGALRLTETIAEFFTKCFYDSGIYAARFT